MMAIDQHSIDPLVDILSVIYEQEINELAQTPMLGNPNRDFFKMANVNGVAEEDLNNHVMFLEHVMSEANRQGAQSH